MQIPRLRGAAMLTCRSARDDNVVEWEHKAEASFHLLVPLIENHDEWGTRRVPVGLRGVALRGLLINLHVSNTVMSGHPRAYNVLQSSCSQSLLMRRSVISLRAKRSRGFLI